MEPVPLIRASHLKPIIGVLREIGAPVERLLTQARLPGSALADPERLIPERPVWALFEIAARTQGIADFGCLLGRKIGIAEIGAFGELISHSTTLYETLRQFCRLVRTHSTRATFSLAEGDEVLWFRRHGIHSIDIGRWQVEQYALTLMVELVRLCAVSSWRPAEVCLQVDSLAGLGNIELIGDIRVHPGHPLTAVAIPRAMLSLPVRATGHCSVAMDPVLDSVSTGPTSPGKDLCASIRSVLETYLPDGYPTIETIAEVAGTSVRTLQRRLADSGLDYSGLVEQVRFGKARAALGDPGAGITDLAHDLGYTDPAHFTRAFRRWSGVSPREFRRQQIH